MKIMICITHTGFIFGEHQTAILGLDRTGIDIAWATAGNSLIYDARNRAAQLAIEGGYNYLLFIDSDMLPPTDTIKRLLKHDVDIVSGLYFKRIYPHLPVAYTEFNVLSDGLKHKYLEEWEDELMPIHAVGMGCCLIKVSVLKEMQKEFDNHLFDCQTGIGEDQMFCVRARQEGFSIWLDPTLIVPHLSIQPITEKHYIHAVENENKLNP